MVVREIVISNEMIAAGREAMEEARRLCLEENDLVIEVYLAMLGASYIQQESLH